MLVRNITFFQIAMCDKRERESNAILDAPPEKGLRKSEKQFRVTEGADVQLKISVQVRWFLNVVDLHSISFYILTFLATGESLFISRRCSIRCSSGFQTHHNDKRFAGSERKRQSRVF